MPGKPVKGGQLTIATERDATTLDPTSAQDVYSNTILALTTDTLFEINDKGQIVGRLVERTDNPQPNVYVLTLRRGVKFQDGTELNAEAVKFNLERHISDAKAATFQDLKGITGIDTPDPLTVIITLDAPFAPFPSLLTSGAGFIQSPAAIQKLGDSLQRDLTGAGSGPFEFVSWAPDNQIILDRNPDFWGTDADGTRLPYLDRIIVKPVPDDNARLAALKTGAADVLMGNPPYKDVASLQQSSDLNIQEIPGHGFQVMFLNTAREPFKIPGVRRALSFAIDRDQLRQMALFGHGAPLELPVPKAVPWAYLGEYRPYAQRDISRAKQELASAGVSDVSFALQIARDSPQLQQVAELIQGQIKDAGFQMEVQPTESASIQQNASTGEYQALSLAWSGSVEPDRDLYPLLSSSSAFNLAKYSNSEFDKLLDDGRSNLDLFKRAAIYKEAQKTIVQDQPIIVLYGESQISTVRKNVQDYPQTYNDWWGGRDLAKVWIAR
jgi:peptide/nickel transport system substrate-binding protein